MSQLNSELEKVLEKANEFLSGNPDLDPEEVLHKASELVFSRNSHYGNLLLNMKYIYLRKNKFVKNGKAIPSPHDAIAQYAAKKILMQKDRKIFKAIYLRDELCSAVSAGHALVRLADDYGGLKIQSIRHKYHSYTINDKEKLEQIAEGNFT
jgi:hypothetical protein